jgi:DNA-binding MarR family transcriptional regulator
MDAYAFDRDDVRYSDSAPILIAGSSPSALARAARIIEASGSRIAARLDIADARPRIDQQIAASSVWIEIDSDGGECMDELLESVDRDAANGRFAAVVSVTPDLIDTVAARLSCGTVELIVSGDDAERTSALAIVTSRMGAPLALSDVASDRNADRLRQLSDEVGRIAATLARLSTGPAPAPAHPFQMPSSSDAPAVSLETVRTVIRARRLRARYFHEELFADPAWDMLLDLLQAEIAHLPVPVSSLCIAAAVPATTALRWLKTMVSQGLFLRRADPHDGRRVFVELAPEASQALRRYFAEIGPAATV